jgi:XTP/dITP diphosphohydrolase
MKVLVATRSLHKLREIRGILRPLEAIDLVGPASVGLAPDPAEEEIEVHDTFEANAGAKARWFAERSGLPTLADDSGLEVDLLGGEPGVRSKRFAPDGDTLSGEDRDRANNEHLLERLGEAPLSERTARFVCVAVLTGPGIGTRVERGEAAGLILGRPRGWGGFGYDPLFHDSEAGRSFAELSEAEKAERGHRGKAFRAMIPHLEALVAGGAG